MIFLFYLLACVYFMPPLNKHTLKYKVHRAEILYLLFFVNSLMSRMVPDKSGTLWCFIWKANLKTA